MVDVDLPAATDLAGLQRRINKLCGPAIHGARNAGWCSDPEFNAHFQRSVAPLPLPRAQLARAQSVLGAHAAWHVVEPLKLWAMNLACDPFIGEHDFTSFCRRPKVAGADDAIDDPPPGDQRRLARGAG